MKKRTAVITVLVFMLLCGACFATESISLSEVDSTNYDQYIKPVRDAYGFNIGECNRKYLPHEEYFYGRTYDHWNVDKVYDSELIYDLFISFEKSSCRMSSVKNEDGGIRMTWKGTSGAEKYEVYKKTGASSWKKVKTTALKSWTDSSVKSGKSYRYRVRGIKYVDGKEVKGAFSGSSAIVRLESPSVISVKGIGDRKIRVKWHIRRNADCYQVKCVGEKASRIKTVKGRNSMSTVICGLTKNKVYSVYVRAGKNGSYSAWSRRVYVRAK